jgi:hypothetical protein
MAVDLLEYVGFLLLFLGMSPSSKPDCFYAVMACAAIVYCGTN